MKTNRGARGSVTLALVVLAAVVSAAPLSAATITDAMASFDRAYIPVLALTSQGKAEASSKAMTILKAEWPRWVSENAGAYADQGWSQAIAKVGQVIAESEALIAKSDLAGAHEALEQVRDILMTQRDARAISYYVDGLNHYHEAMEELAAVTAGKTAESLTAGDIERLASLLPETRALWTRAQQAPFDARDLRLCSSADRRTAQGDGRHDGEHRRGRTGRRQRQTSRPCSRPSKRSSLRSQRRS